MAIRRAIESRQLGTARLRPVTEAGNLRSGNPCTEASRTSTTSPPAVVQGDVEPTPGGQSSTSRAPGRSFYQPRSRRWTSLRGEVSNPDLGLQRTPCCHYTTPEGPAAGRPGLRAMTALLSVRLPPPGTLGYSLPNPFARRFNTSRAPHSVRSTLDPAPRHMCVPDRPED